SVTLVFLSFAATALTVFALTAAVQVVVPAGQPTLIPVSSRSFLPLRVTFTGPRPVTVATSSGGGGEAGLAYVIARVAVTVLPGWSATTALTVFGPSASVIGADHVPSPATETSAPLTFSDATPLLSDAVPLTVTPAVSTVEPSAAGSVIATDGTPRVSS